jgi:hypothetical protein
MQNRTACLASAMPLHALTSNLSSATRLKHDTLLVLTTYSSMPLRRLFLKTRSRSYYFSFQHI